MFDLEIKDNKITVTSLQIAKEFDRRHADVIRSIENKKNMLDEESNLVFTHRDIAFGYFLDKNGQKRKIYILTKRAALILMPYIGGRKSLQGQASLVDTFEKMESNIPELLDANKRLGIENKYLQEKTKNIMTPNMKLIAIAMKRKYNEKTLVAISNAIVYNIPISVKTKDSSKYLVTAQQVRPFLSKDWTPQPLHNALIEKGYIVKSEMGHLITEEGYKHKGCNKKDKKWDIPAFPINIWNDLVCIPLDSQKEPITKRLEFDQEELIPFPYPFKKTTSELISNLIH